MILSNSAREWDRKIKMPSDKKPHYKTSVLNGKTTKNNPTTYLHIYYLLSFCTEEKSGKIDSKLALTIKRGCLENIA